MTSALDKSAAAILEERARKLAPPTSTGQRPIDSTIVIVGIGSERFGIPIEGLTRIMRTPRLAHLPHCAPWVAGLFHLRGEMICAIDLARWLGISSGPEGAFVAVVEGSRGKIGLLVESMLGTRTVFRDQISQDLVACAVRSGHPLRATTDDLVTLLDLERLFESPQLLIGVPSAPTEASR